LREVQNEIMTQVKFKTLQSGFRGFIGVNHRNEILTSTLTGEALDSPSGSKGEK